MKLSILALLVLSPLFGFQHGPDIPKFDDYVLNNLEVVSFGETLDSGMKTSMDMSLGSSDGARCRIRKNGGDSVILIKSRASKRRHQSELMLNYCYGTVSRSQDTLIFQVTSNFPKLFLHKLGDDSVVVLSRNVSIKLIAHDASGEMVIPHISSFGSDIEVYCLPVMVDKSEMYKMRHKKKNIATFTYFVITDDDGQKRQFDAGDYLLIGGDQFFSAETNPAI